MIPCSRTLTYYTFSLSKPTCPKQKGISWNVPECPSYPHVVDVAGVSNHLNCHEELYSTEAGNLIAYQLRGIEGLPPQFRLRQQVGFKQSMAIIAKLVGCLELRGAPVDTSHFGHVKPHSQNPT